MFLVVNSASWASLTVANHYIQLRQIPPINVFYLDWTEGIDSITGEVYREKILMPVINALDRRGLQPQIDYVVFSSDFPLTINLAGDYAANVKFSELAKPAVSLSSATYLWHLIASKQPYVMDLHINHYMRGFQNQKTKVDRTVALPTFGFRSWYGWGNSGELLESGGQPYLLSTVLAVTSGRGNSVTEALNYLTRSAKADGTRPAGTIYFTRTEDVRSTARVDEIATAIAELEKLGVKGQVVSTPMPQGAGNVAGLMMGAANFSWAASRSTILPGAICENLTSFGGVLIEGGSSQTPLTELLRYGAAGSSGTVVEPLAVAQKFPSPNIHVHYARGSSLAEAFYQSVFGPAQLLIVGDALCQPWANIPQVRVNGVKPNEKVSATVVLKPEARLPRPGKIDHFELFVDGRRMATLAEGQSFEWDTTSEADGAHELRVVAVEASPIATQGRAVIPLVVENTGRTALMATQPAGKVRWDEALAVRVKVPEAKQIFVLNNGRVLGTITGDSGQVNVNPRVLGLGPVSLQALAVSGTDGMRIAPPPVTLQVEPAQPLPAIAAPPRLARGLVLQLPDRKVVPIQETRNPSWLSEAGIGPNQPYIMQGFFDVETDETYQFQLWHHGDLKLIVDGKVLYEGRDGNYQQKFVPVALARGTHRLTVSGTSGTNVKLQILFGGPGALSLDGARFKHQSR